MAVFLTTQKAIDYDQTNKLLRSVFYCDDPTDWEAEDLVIVGMPTGYDIWAGSWCYDKAGNMAIMDSEGAWNWLGSTPDNLSKVVEILKNNEKKG